VLIEEFFAQAGVSRRELDRVRRGLQGPIGCERVRRAAAVVPSTVIADPAPFSTCRSKCAKTRPFRNLETAGSAIEIPAWNQELARFCMTGRRQTAGVVAGSAKLWYEVAERKAIFGPAVRRDDSSMRGLRRESQPAVAGLRLSPKGRFLDEGIETATIRRGGCTGTRPCYRSRAHPAVLAALGHYADVLDEQEVRGSRCRPR
jgi:hypothetical protein